MDGWMDGRTNYVPSLSDLANVLVAEYEFTSRAQPLVESFKSDSGG